MLGVVATVSATRMLLHHGMTDRGWVARLGADKALVVGAVAYRLLAGVGLPPPVVLAPRGVEPRDDWPPAAVVDLDPRAFMMAASLDPEVDALVIGGDRTLQAAFQYAGVVYLEMLFGTLPADGSRFGGDDGWGAWTVEDSRRLETGERTYGLRFELHRRV